MATVEDPSESIAEALRRIHPELDAVRRASGDPVYLVGGAVRDLLLGRGRADVDLVVEGDAAALARRLGAEVVAHERFGTAKVELDGHELDVATARSESYPHPGALPVVQPAATIEEDLSRRDFTINAMAISLDAPRLIDPYGGRADLAAELLRVLHSRSFEDDPTRAIRAARYAARFGFTLEPETEKLLKATGLDTVSSDRRRSELLRLADEATAPRALALLVEWGLLRPREGGLDLAQRVSELLTSSMWSEEVGHDRAGAVLAAAFGPPGGEVELAAQRPERPSQAAELAGGCHPRQLVLARALGATWLDEYVSTWRRVELEITGEDLIGAGVPEGPAVGRGLAEALRRKLDGELSGRERELAVAMEVAREHDGMA